MLTVVDYTVASLQIKGCLYVGGSLLQVFVHLKQLWERWLNSYLIDRLFDSNFLSNHNISGCKQR